jgi:hypothetical protein
MKRQLSQIITQLDEAEKRVEKLGDVIPDAVWTQRNDPSRWSVAECIAHLNLTTDAYLPRVRKAIAEARQLPPAAGQYKRDTLGAMFSAMVGPLPSIGRFRFGRVKTAAAFVPKGDQPKNVSLAEFRRLQMLLSDLVRESDGLAIDRVMITSPFGEKIRYSCYSAFVILARHQMRHLDQAELVWGDTDA